MRKLACAAALAALLALHARAQDPGQTADDTTKRAPKGLAGQGLTQAQVDAAIEKGKQFLVAKLAAASDDEIGDNENNLLMALALTHTDALAKDKALAERVLKLFYARPIGKTYDTAVVSLALEHLGGAVHRERIADAAKFLVERQGQDKGWTYGQPIEGAPVRTPPALDPARAVIEVTGGLPLAGARGGAKKVERKGGFTGEGEAPPDLSNSQFALLGLHSALVSGIETPKETWEGAIEFFSAKQNEDGGWAYQNQGDPSYGSMTCAGVSSLAISLAALGKDPRADERVKRGLAWIAKHFALDKNPVAGEGAEPHEHHYYAIYAIERVAVLLGLDFVGEHEWYPEGARYLLSKQKPDGSWFLSDEPGATDDGPINCTSYALLFLTRATTPLAARKGGNGTLRTALSGKLEAAAEPTGLLFILDASDSMNMKVGEKTRWEIVRESAKRLVQKLQDGALVGLRVYGHNPSNPKKVDENESELLIPVGKLDRAKFQSVVDAIKPQGRTPIAMSFDRAGEKDLADAPACRVLLLSDGAETGGLDPVASAKKLAANPKCLGIDCLGFSIAHDPKARAQLMEIARVGKGRYTESEDPDVIATAGARASSEYVLLDAAGKEVARGTLGDGRSLPEGEFKLQVKVGGETHEAVVWVNTGVETKATVYPERAKKK